MSGQFGALPFIYGTVVTSAIAILLALPVSVGLALFLGEMGPRALRRPVSFAVETLAAIPSVVYGLWGLFVLVPLLRNPVEPFLGQALGFLPFFRGPPIGLGYLAAGLILAIMILPTISSVTLDVFKTVPSALKEGALALGATRWEMIRMTVLPYARSGIVGGIVTASLLAIARAAGETAPLLFTALNNQYWNLRPDEPTASLTVQIFNYAISPYESWHAQAWTAALVLLLLVGLLNLGARVASRGRLGGAR